MGPDYRKTYTRHFVDNGGGLHVNYGIVTFLGSDHGVVIRDTRDVLPCLLM